MSLAQYSKEQLNEMSMIELAYLILSGKSERKAISFKELLDEVVSVLNLSEEEVRAKIAQFYTDLNIDGRFISVGDNQWGLRTWYPYDQIDEEVQPVAKPKKKKKAKKVADDELDDYEGLDDEDLDYDDIDDYEDEAEDELEDEEFDELESDDFEDEEDVIEVDDYEVEDEEIEADLDYEEEDEDESEDIEEDEDL